jgi:cyclopropane fatty-acyl-phospholipid synthase-like methyltransferase
MDRDEYQRFANLSFDDFRRMALDSSLSNHEKVGFPNEYREGKEQAIFNDIRSKLTSLNDRDKIVLDIGPGCSGLALMLIDLCRSNGHSLILVDSQEMLSQLPDSAGVRKIAGYYPHCAGLADEFHARVDVILTYSVLQYVFANANVSDFLEQSLALLAPGGEMLIGDIPNISKRKRFFSSPAGIRFHQDFMQTQGQPEPILNQVEPRQIDDAVVFSLLTRARQTGFDAYVVPQRPDLPMANRREDILIRRP